MEKEAMEANGNQVDPLDYNTRLPPRKRLLAGLKKQTSVPSSSLPLHFISRDLEAHFHYLLNSNNLSPEEIIKASNTAALEAAEVAAAAKAVAFEKAAAAAKAKAFARSAIELVASITRKGAGKESFSTRNKVKKKHVPVKLLYKTNRPVVSCDRDEELARKLHRAMNSSPRISKASNKRNVTVRVPRDSGKGAICDGNSFSFYDGNAESSNGNSVDQVVENVQLCSKADFFEKEVEPRDLNERDRRVAKTSSGTSGKKLKIKQKKLPLSQCCSRDREGFREMSVYKFCTLAAVPKVKYSSINIPVLSGKPSSGGEESMETTSMQKCKKFKISQCYSESTVVHPLCSNPTVTATSS